MLTITSDTIIHAPPMDTWELLTDHDRLAGWMGLSQAFQVSPGPQEFNGTFSVRKLIKSLFVMQERITCFEPGRRLKYDVINGAPGYTTKGQFMLTPMHDGDSTLVWWKVTLHPYIPGTGILIKRVLSEALDSALSRLKQQLEPELLLGVEAAALQEDSLSNSSGDSQSRLKIAGMPSESDITVGA